MRLVWAVVPLILMVSMVGIIGVQDAESQIYASSPFSADLAIDTPPNLGETTDVTLTFVNAYGFNRDTIEQFPVIIRLPDGLELVSGELETTHFWQQGDTLEVTVEVKAIQNGNWTIQGVGFRGAVDYLRLVIDEDSSYIHEGNFPSSIPPRHYVGDYFQESFAGESKFLVGNVTSKISSGPPLKEKMASIPRCENTSDKFPNSTLTSQQKIIQSYYQSDLVVTGQVINKTTYTSNEKNWDILHIEIQDILNPHPNFTNDVDNSIILVSAKCWSYSGNLENEWSFDVDDNVFLYLNRIHDVRFTISNPIKDTSIDSNVMSIPSPLTQNHAIKSGMWNNDWNKIYCKPSLVPITKPNAEFVCVKPSTTEKLIERGWTSNPSFIEKCNLLNGNWNYEFHNCEGGEEPSEFTCEDVGGTVSCMSREQRQSLNDLCIYVCEFEQ